MYKYAKRVLDIVISICVLIVFFIPMIIIAIAIKIDSEGPVFFKQIRTGKDGKEFKLYKFRSMTASNDVRNLSKENELTKVGAFLRKTSLDELGQIINVIKGDMSWIGPRPWIVEYYQNFTNEQKRRVEVKPGLTGLAQCSGRNNLSIFDKINYDIEYVNTISLKTDIKIVFMTIKSVLKKEGIEISKTGIKDEIDALHENYLYVTNQIPVLSEEEIKSYEQVNA